MIRYKSSKEPIQLQISKQDTEVDSEALDIKKVIRKISEWNIIDKTFFS